MTKMRSTVKPRIFTVREGTRKHRVGSQVGLLLLTEKLQICLRAGLYP